MVWTPVEEEEEEGAVVWRTAGEARVWISGSGLGVAGSVGGKNGKGEGGSVGYYNYRSVIRVLFS